MHMREMRFFFAMFFVTLGPWGLVQRFLWRNVHPPAKNTHTHTRLWVASLRGGRAQTHQLLAGWVTSASTAPLIKTRPCASELRLPRPKKKWRALPAKSKQPNADLTTQDLGTIQPFEWLLGSEARVELDQMTKSILGQAVGTTKWHEQHLKAKDKKKKSEKEAEETENAATMRFFG